MTSFATDIRPLFREKDVQSMAYLFDLRSYQEVKEHVEGIRETVSNGSMPCDRAWSPEQIATLDTWISEGCPE